jgi:hypothetical protein
MVTGAADGAIVTGAEEGAVVGAPSTVNGLTLAAVTVALVREAELC